jgi:hypothetical protein
VGLLWGAAGLILFVPIFGILKIIFDHSSELKPLGFLIGYERPGSGEDELKKKIFLSRKDRLLERTWKNMSVCILVNIFLHN